MTPGIRLDLRYKNRLEAFLLPWVLAAGFFYLLVHLTLMWKEIRRRQGV